MLGVAGRVGPVVCQGAVYFTGFVNLDLGLRIFSIFIFFNGQNIISTLLHLQSTALNIYVTEKECFLPKHRVSWTKSD